MLKTTLLTEQSHCLHCTLRVRLRGSRFNAWKKGSFVTERMSAQLPQAGINLGTICVNIQIPLPPLEVQREIVAEIEGYQKVIDGARAVIENYRPHIAVDPDWPLDTAKDICEV